MQGDEFLIKYNNNSRNKTKPINASEVRLIETCCQKQGLTSLSLSDLQKNNTQQPTNYLPWIIGGGIVLILGIIIAYFLFKKKKE